MIRKIKLFWEDRDLELSLLTAVFAAYLGFGVWMDLIGVPFVGVIVGFWCGRIFGSIKKCWELERKWRKAVRK